MNQDGKDSKPQNESTEPVNTLQGTTGWHGFWRRYRNKAIGFVGWYVLNSAIWLLLGARPGDDLGQTVILALWLGPFNILVWFVLAAIKTTREYASGVVAALALNFLISLVMGLLTNALCFVPFIFPDFG